MAWTPAVPTPRSEAALAGELRGRRTTRHHAGRQALGRCSGLRLGGAKELLPVVHRARGHRPGMEIRRGESIEFFLLPLTVLDEICSYNTDA
uniref:Uncharacterized protein n=1 Tax=Oryza meridionalis TaxID=40149 RepID=A0A0E0DYJ5_9ORYZ